MEFLLIFFARAFLRPTLLRINGTPTAMAASTVARIKNPRVVPVDRVIPKAMAAPTEIPNDGRQSSVRITVQHSGGNERAATTKTAAYQP